MVLISVPQYEQDFCQKDMKAVKLNLKAKPLLLAPAM